MTTEPKAQRIDSGIRRTEPDPNEPRELTLDELSEVGGGIIKHAPMPDSRVVKF